MSWQRHLLFALALLSAAAWLTTLEASAQSLGTPPTGASPPKVVDTARQTVQTVQSAAKPVQASAAQAVKPAASVAAPVAQTVASSTSGHKATTTVQAAATTVVPRPSVLVTQPMSTQPVSTQPVATLAGPTQPVSTLPPAPDSVAAPLDPVAPAPEPSASPPAPLPAAADVLAAPPAPLPVPWIELEVAPVVDQSQAVVDQVAVPVEPSQAVTEQTQAVVEQTQAVIEQTQAVVDQRGAVLVGQVVSEAAVAALVDAAQAAGPAGADERHAAARAPSAATARPRGSVAVRESAPTVAGAVPELLLELARGEVPVSAYVATPEPTALAPLAESAIQSEQPAAAPAPVENREPAAPLGDMSNWAVIEPRGTVMYALPSASSVSPTDATAPLASDVRGFDASILPMPLASPTETPAPRPTPASAPSALPASIGTPTFATVGALAPTSPRLVVHGLWDRLDASGRTLPSVIVLPNLAPPG